MNENHNLTKTIAEKEKALETTRKEIEVASMKAARLEKELEILKQASQILLGKTEVEPVVAAGKRAVNIKRPTLADVAEQVLKDHEELHIDDLMKRLAAKGVRASKPTVISALSKLIGKRFFRTKPGTFSVYEKVESGPAKGLSMFSS